MNKLILKQEVLDAYDGYVKAFVKGNTKKVEKAIVINTEFLSKYVKALRSFGVREAFEVETLKDSTHPGFIEREKEFIYR